MMRHLGHVGQFLRAYCASPWCQPLLQAQEAVMAELLSKQFGYFALQVGDAYSLSNAWKQCKVGCQVVVSDHPSVSVSMVSALDELPVKSDSVDVVVLAHALEQVDDPYALLREMDRVLVTDGRVLVLGFSPMNAWRGRWFGRHKQGLQRLSFYTPGRLVDWLQTLGFEIEQVHFHPEGGWQRWLPWLASPCTQGYTLSARKARSRVRLIGLRDGWRWQSLLPQLARRNMMEKRQHEKH